MGISTGIRSYNTRQQTIKIYRDIYVPNDRRIEIEKKCVCYVEKIFDNDNKIIEFDGVKPTHDMNFRESLIQF